MEEEQHQQHHHQYGGGGAGNNTTNTTNMADLRQFFSPIPTHHFPQPSPAAAHHTLFSSAAGAFTPLHHHYDTMMLVAGGRDHVLQVAGVGGIHDFRSDSTATSTATAAVGMTPASSGAAAGFDVEAGWRGSGGGGGFGLGVGGGDGGATARWPRQETLTLLEIRSRLDHKFKEANHKGPLWDEVSRIMSEEHGYQRSGKKCREKFENLYKYYKKTKEGKAGRQDGKHYRFFRQLEALYGEASHSHQIASCEHTHLNMIGNNTTTTTLQFNSTINTATTNGQCNDHQEGFNSISLSNSSSDYDTSSSEGNELDRVGSMENGESSMDMMARSRKRRGRRSWKAKIKDFIDSQMRKIIEKQEAWLEKMMSTLEHKDQERMSKEEEWRKQEAQRMEREHKFWAEERAWIEARDKALMDALQRITGKEVVVMENDISSDHTEELLMAARYHQKQQQSQEEEENNGDVNDDQTAGNEDRWPESEMIKLIELRVSMQTRFDQCGQSEEDNLWDEISTRMVCLGHDRSATMCKEKWDFINKVVVERANNNKDLSKKRKENWRTRSTDCNSNSSHHQRQQLQTSEANNLYNYGEINSQEGMGLAPPEIGLGGGGNPTMNDSCLRILLGDGGEAHLWESYGVKLNKGETH